MTDNRSSLRFDHREIAVIFSLFIFVSLLMFTVGILVGKGLAQAKYEGVLLLDRQHLGVNSTTDGSDDSAANAIASAGTSVSTDTPLTAPDAAKAAAKTDPAHTAPATSTNANKPVETAQAEATSAPLQLIPKDSPARILAGSSLREPGSSKETDDLLKNPKLRALVDNDAPVGSHKRGPASGDSPGNVPAPAAAIAADALAQSYATGPFTVQIGSYPTEKDAAERVENLKKLGFPHAYFSAKQWSDTKETWYRVWLGYYPDYESAKRSGRVLQQRGEVTNYLVRKSDSTR